MVRDESARRFIIAWLSCVIGLVLSMIVLGGVTRLTDSGLSMVDWRPVTGWLPPLTESAWQAEFAKYKTFPEYEKINRGMNLGEFKLIFAYEFAHRVLGRLIGLAYAVPLFYILARGWVRADLGWRLIALLFLGGSQGVVGWWMVKSGLVDRPDVSHYRLAVHLTLALVIMCAITWVWLTIHKRSGEFKPLTLNLGMILTATVFLQVISGAFMAGLDAGLTYNTWPLMDGQLIPEHYWRHAPVWLAPLEHITAVQLNHRMGAYAVLAFAIYLYWKTGRSNNANPWAIIVLKIVLAQGILGVMTLLYVVPIILGALHQFGAALVLICCVCYWHYSVYGAPDQKTLLTEE